MSDMSLSAALSAAQAALASAEEANGMAQGLADKLEDIHTRLLSIEGSGLAPTRIQSTILLAAETSNIQREQAERMASLLAGITELIG